MKRKCEREREREDLFYRPRFSVNVLFKRRFVEFRNVAWVDNSKRSLFEDIDRYKNQVKRYNVNLISNGLKW